MFKPINLAKNTDVIDLFKRAGPLFIAFGDENRQHIVVELLKHPRLSVNDITASTPLSRPAVSHHLKILQQAGIVSADKLGTQRLYHLSEDAITQVDLMESLAKALRECTKWTEQ